MGKNQTKKPQKYLYVDFSPYNAERRHDCGARK